MGLQQRALRTGFSQDVTGTRTLFYSPEFVDLRGRNVLLIGSLAVNNG